MRRAESVVREVAEALRSNGYDVVLREGEPFELIASGKGVTACIAFIDKGGGLSKLSVRPGCGSGLSVIDCSNAESVKECVVRLLQILEEWAAGAEK